MDGLLLMLLCLSVPIGIMVHRWEQDILQEAAAQRRRKLVQRIKAVR